MDRETLEQFFVEKIQQLARVASEEEVEPILAEMQGRLRTVEGRKVLAGVVGGLSDELDTLLTDRDVSVAPWVFALLRVGARLLPNTKVEYNTASLGLLLGLARGQLDLAESCGSRAAQLAVDFDLDELTQAAIFGNLGLLAQNRGDLDRAWWWHLRAREIQERLAPDSLSVASTCVNLGVIAALRGDLEAAWGWQSRSREIKERLAPDSLTVAGTYGNLGIIALECGDLDGAWGWQSRAREIQERLAPDSLTVASTYTNLGNIARMWGDLEAAWGWQSRSWEIKERLAPDSLTVASTYVNLGNIARDRGDLEGAWGWQSRAREIQERLTPDSLTLAGTYGNLGVIAHDHGDLDGAWGWQSRAREIQERLAPDSLMVAITYGNLGNIACLRGDLDGAEEILLRSAAIFERKGPGNADGLKGFYNLLLPEMRRDPDKVLDCLLRAFLALQNVAAMRSGGDSLHIVHEYGGFGEELEQALLDRGDHADAYRVHETLRSLSLKLHLVRSQRDATTERYQREIAGLEQQLAQLDAQGGDPELAEAIIRQRDAVLADLRAHQDQVYGVPPMDAAEVARQFGPGTLVLDYHVESARTTLYVLFRGDLRVVHLQYKGQPIGATAAEGNVAWADLIPFLKDGGEPWSVFDWFAADEERRSAVENALLAAVNAEIRACDRVLIAADGPLGMVPFGALRVQVDDKRILLEDHCLVSSMVSAGALALARTIPPSDDAGDPLVAGVNPPCHTGYSLDAQIQAHMAAARRQHLPSDGALVTRDFNGIPFAPKEAETIAALLGCASVTQEQASRARLLDAIRTANIVHFAGHSYFRQDYPSYSGLIVYPSVDDFDVIFAQDLEGVRLKARFVCLSSCQSGQGGQTGGEGLVGLAYFLLKAGVPCVVASLWKVADETTSLLMEQFYKNLKAGDTVGEALRRAKRWLREDSQVGDVSNPYFWAPFVVIGDGDVKL